MSDVLTNSPDSVITSKPAQDGVNIRDIVYPFHAQSVRENTNHNIKITAHVATDVYDDIVLNAADMEDILGVLLNNAITHTIKGRVHLHVDLATIENEQYLHLIVADTGKGLNKDQLAALKLMMHTDQKPGLDLSTDAATPNLHHVFKILHACNGKLLITTREGVGSEFTVRIPIKRADIALGANDDLIDIEELWQNAAHVETDAASTPDNMEIVSDEYENNASLFAPEVLSNEFDETLISGIVDNSRSGFSRRNARAFTQAAADVDFTDMQILIVEDILINQEVLKSLLSPAGCIISTANNGQEAVDMTEVQPYDVILMDIRMPIMNGVIATKTIRDGNTPNKDIPIIALTADASEENNAHCLAAGADVFLTKPVVISELFSAIRYACSQKARRSESREDFANNARQRA